MTTPDFPDWRQPITTAAHDDVIYSGLAKPGGQTFDVSAYQTLIVRYVGGGAQVLIRQFDSIGTLIDAEVFFVNGQPVTWRLIGTSIQVIGDATAQIVIVGSSRQAITRLDQRQFAAGLLSLNINPVVVGANMFGGAGVFTAIPMGPCSIRFAASAAVTTGYFSLVEIDGSIVMPVCETTELIAGPSAGKGTLVKNLYVPAQCGLQYNCTGAAGGVVSVIIAAGSIP